MFINVGVQPNQAYQNGLAPSVFFLRVLDTFYPFLFSNWINFTPSHLLDTSYARLLIFEKLPPCPFIKYIFSLPVN